MIYNGYANTKRLTTTTSWQEHQIDSDVQFIIIRNASANKVYFNFDSEDPVNYFTLCAVLQSVKMQVKGGTSICYKSDAGSDVLEILSWG